MAKSALGRVLGTQKKPSMGGKIAGTHAPASTCYDRGGKKSSKGKK